MCKQVRQYISILAAVFFYYIIHEGAHLLSALYLGVFKQLNFMSLGIQVDVHHMQMTDFQMGFFCLSGAAATLLIGWLLVLLCKPVCNEKSKVFRAVMWYTSLIMLLLDPLYLSLLCVFWRWGYERNSVAVTGTSGTSWFRVPWYHQWHHGMAVFAAQI